MACVMFVSPSTRLSFCVWCDRTKHFFHSYVNVITVEADYWTVAQHHGVRFVICIELHVWSLAGLYVRQSTKTFFLEIAFFAVFFVVALLLRPGKCILL